MVISLSQTLFLSAVARKLVRLWKLLRIRTSPGLLKATSRTAPRPRLLRCLSLTSVLGIKIKVLRVGNRRSDTVYLDVRLEIADANFGSIREVAYIMLIFYDTCC